MKKNLLLGFTIVLIVSFLLIGCGAKTPATKTDTSKPEATKTAEITATPEATKAPEATTAVVEYKESPYFTGKDLPAVKDRLPKEPKIANEMPEDLLTTEIGTYGGTLRTVSSVIEWDADVFVANNEALLNTPGILGKEITGNVLKGYEVTSDQKEFTFHMREDLKWSDGTPVTSEDIRFTIEDVIFNKELTPIFPGWMSSGGTAKGTPLKFTLIDEFTFRFTFDAPYGGLPVRMAIQGWRGYTEFLKPSAFLKKFHKTFNKDTAALEAAIKEAKFKPGEWVNLFNDKDITNFELTNSKSIGFPRLYPWLYTKKTENTSEFERNPYYFKVDKAGNQLPYFDKLVSTYVTDMEIVTMKILSGEVDFARESAAMNNMTLYKDNETKGNYKVYMTDSHVTRTDVYLNLTYKDENWRKVVLDERFRKALNLGINRKEIIDTIYYGFAQPSIIQDTTFDVAAANKLLDEMGMTKGTDGFRKGPDGKKFSIPFEVTSRIPETIPFAELLVEQWKALGLDITMKKLDGALWSTRVSANELHATMETTPTPLWYSGDWHPGFWGTLWDSYQNSGGKQGEKPPADVQKLYDLIAKVSTAKPEDGIKAVDEVKAEVRKHNWFFIPLSSTKQPLIINSKIGNVSDKAFSIATNFSAEQMFYKK